MTTKRPFDILASVTFIILLSPAMLVISLCVMLDSLGPAVFRQARVGRWGHSFVLFKFRSMVMKAESTGPNITMSIDTRITRVGRLLRKYKLDEIPQLFNVFKGEMSLVGPRPELREYVELYPKNTKDKILSVRPGMTDNASIKFRNESELLKNSSDLTKCYVEEILPAKLTLYEQYIDNHSVIGDLMIIFRTIWALAVNDSGRR